MITNISVTFIQFPWIIHVQLLFIIYHIAGNSYRGTDGYTACTRSFLGK